MLKNTAWYWSVSSKANMCGCHRGKYTYWTVYWEFLSPKNNLNHSRGDLCLYTADSFTLHCVRTADDNTRYVLIVLPVSLSVSNWHIRLCFQNRIHMLILLSIHMMMGESKIKEATERHNTSSLNLSSFFEITGPQKQTAPGGWGRPVVATRWSDGSMLGWRRCRHTVRFSVTWDHGQVCKSTTTTWVWESRQTTWAWGYDNSWGACGLGAPWWKRTTWYTVTSHNLCGTTAPTWPVPRIPATEHTCWTCPVWWRRFTIKHCAVWWWPNTFLVYFTLLKCRK